MRLVIDMQGAQSSGSRNRGIGRYTLALAQELARQRGDSEVVLVLNGTFRDTIEPLKAAFAELLPADAIRVWFPPVPCSFADPVNDQRRIAAEAIFETFLTSLQPDVILITSLFEGLGDDVVTSVGRLASAVPTAVVLYDLIPLIHSNIYLSNPVVARWYHRKLDDMRRAGMLLSISASSGRESVDHLDFPAERVVNISTACNAEFKPVKLTADRRLSLEARYGLNKPYVMYTGGIDHRKNIEGLIRAYALLPAKLRSRHQLAIVCSAQEADRARLTRLGRDAGLASGELVMTGFVPDDDLLALYNGCALFVFPSWHEGFGLPALEAMACGRPTIGANTSSLPEVIGWNEAMFDPHDDSAIAALMTKALTDEAFNEQLRLHATKQAETFSWQASAATAWRTIKRMPVAPEITDKLKLPKDRKKLAFLSPLPAARSGIADYSAELLPELARHYEIDIISIQEEQITDTWTTSNSHVRTLQWFRENYFEFDRVIYHFGNSHFHGHMFQLLEDFPGFVVLHDFYLSNIIAHLDLSGEQPGLWTKTLLSDHGWRAVVERFMANDIADVAWAYPCNGDIFRNAIGGIVHSQFGLDLAKLWHSIQDLKNWEHIPLLRKPLTLPADSIAEVRSNARKMLGIRRDDFLVCAFGHLGPIKLNDRLLDTWLASVLANRDDCQLVFVGQNAGGPYGDSIAGRIAQSGGRIRITGFVDQADYRRWLLAADVAVQLRTNSRGETSAAVLDCWNAGLATIVNAHGALAELPDDTVVMLPDDFSDAQLMSALVQLYRDPKRRMSLGANGRARLLAHHGPRSCADAYAAAMEAGYARARMGAHGLLKHLPRMLEALNETDAAAVSRSIVSNLTPRSNQQHWFIDVSTLVLSDSRTGIQRVVRAILRNLLCSPPKDILVEPVYVTPGQSGYRYARKFTSRFLGISDDWCSDEVVEINPGDTILVLDLNFDAWLDQSAMLNDLRSQDVRVFCVVYDILPVLLPHYFAENLVNVFHKWLHTVSEFDGALCISRAVADEFQKWLDANGRLSRKFPFDIHYFHLGGDFDRLELTDRRSGTDSELLEKMASLSSFVMVSTVEPRKGHKVVLDAFDQLWASGQQLQLVIVGKQGWLMEEFVSRLRSHPQLGQCLHWLEGVTDEYLEELYRAATCLIAASEGEGFGLPLIEAARHNLPILARDIPVFREVAGRQAAYFAADVDPSGLASAITNWIKAYNRDRHPRPSEMKWLTWADSAALVSEVLLGNSEPYKRWLPGDTLLYWGNDQRLQTQVGFRSGFFIHTTGRAGLLIYGPYSTMKAGRYTVILSGKSDRVTGQEVVDIAVEKGELILTRTTLDAGKGDWQKVIELILDYDVVDMEIRLLVGVDSELSLEKIVIERGESVDKPISIKKKSRMIRK